MMAWIWTENQNVTTRDIGICGGKTLLEIWTTTCQQWDKLRCIMKVVDSNINPNQHSIPNFKFFVILKFLMGILKRDPYPSPNIATNTYLNSWSSISHN